MYATTDPDESPDIDVVWTVGGSNIPYTGSLDLATIAALPEDEVKMYGYSYGYTVGYR